MKKGQTFISFIADSFKFLLIVLFDFCFITEMQSFFFGLSTCLVGDVALHKTTTYLFSCSKIYYIYVGV